jgi:hypothetical protein
MNKTTPRASARIAVFLMLFTVMCLLTALPASADFIPTSPYAPANGDTIADFEISDGGVLSGYTGSGGALVIPEGVTEIAVNTFASGDLYGGKAPLTGIKLPGTLIVIGGGAFQGQTEMTGPLDLPGGLTTVDTMAFYNTSLTGEVVFPENCSVLGTTLLAGTDITKVTVLAPSIKYTTVPELYYPFHRMPELREITINSVFF